MADKATLKALVQSFYDAQKMRIQAGNRLVANVRVRLGQDPGTPTAEMPEEGQKLLVALLAESDRITDTLAGKDARAQIKAIAEQAGIIGDVFEYELTRHYMRLLESEGAVGRSIARMVKQFPIWDSFLTGVKGCGPMMAAVLISELDPHKARYSSSFWRYAGLDVGPDGRGRSKRADHLVEVQYTDRDGQQATRKSITFNPFLKTKLIGVLATSFLRSNSPYRDTYDGYKHRLESHLIYKDTTKGHRHNMAMRYMVKSFLRDLWLAWRRLEGLPVTAEYANAKLGYPAHLEVSESQSESLQV